METTSGKAGLLLGLGVVVIQLIDVAVHVATGQAELIRILSNVIIGGWAVWSLSGVARVRGAGLAAVAAYLGLNLAFLAMNGLTNPAQGDAPRVTLFVLVGLTTALALWTLSHRRGG